jgi:hypothetical protein
MAHAPAIVRIPLAPTKASAQNGVGYLLRRICPLLAQPGPAKKVRDPVAIV